MSCACGNRICAYVKAFAEGSSGMLKPSVQEAQPPDHEVQPPDHEVQPPTQALAALIGSLLAVATTEALSAPGFSSMPLMAASLLAGGALIAKMAKPASGCQDRTLPAYFCSSCAMVSLALIRTVTVNLLFGFPGFPVGDPLGDPPHAIRATNPTTTGMPCQK